MSELQKPVKVKHKLVGYKVEPYPRMLWICSDIEKVKSLFTPKGGSWGDYSDCDACVYGVRRNSDQSFGYLVWCEEGVPDSTILHECGHVALHIFQDIGEEEIFNAQEPFCYLLEWVYSKIKEFYGKRSVGKDQE